MFVTLDPSLKRNRMTSNKKFHAPSLCFLHAVHLCFHHAEPPPPPHISPEQNNFEEERVLVVPSASSSGVVPSFACSNLHHTTHRITPPHKSPELCVELVNILELPMTKIPLRAWILWLIGYLWVGMEFETK